MGYLHIDNTYKHPEFFAGEDQCAYVLEKIHGTSAHVRYCRGELTFFSGGEKHENFVKLFDGEALHAFMGREAERLGTDTLTIFGEAYGGRQQGMKDTYGPNLRFVAFDVLPGEVTVNDHRQGWLDVPSAESVVKNCGLEFVWWQRIVLSVGGADTARDSDSVQAIRNGMGPGKIMEGVVIRPLCERYRPDGSRVILKHKRPEFGETLKARKVVPLDRIEVLQNAQAIADEWVTAERLSHVLDHLRADRLSVRQETDCEAESPSFEPKDTPDVIRAMLEDVRREGAGEIEWSKEADRAVATATAKLFKARVMAVPA